MPKIIVVIPAYNEALSIGKVVAEIPRTSVHEIIVVDNASTDATAKIAKAAGADVAYEPEPGYGAACLRGMARATATPRGISMDRMIAVKRI